MNRAISFTLFALVFEIPQVTTSNNRIAAGLKPTDIVLVTGASCERLEIIKAARAFRYDVDVKRLLLLLWLLDWFAPWLGSLCGKCVAI